MIHKEIGLAHQDYLTFFGFNEPPFRLSPDPSFFFPGKAHVAARGVLKFAIDRGEGFMVLIGPAGSGKSLLLRMILLELSPQKIPAVVVTPTAGPAGLIRMIIEELGRSAPATDDISILLKEFQNTILDLASQGKEALIVIDEAQNLSIETLEQLRMLSNIETSQRKLLQILLIGQTELDGLLQDARLGQLTQRIVIKEALSPLSKDEIREYVKYRLARAGRGDIDLDSRAVAKIAALTQGIPRLINRLMDRTLLMSAAKGSTQIDPQTIEEAQKTLPQPCNSRPGLFTRFTQRPVFWILLAGLSTFAVTIGLFIWYLEKSALKG